MGSGNRHFSTQRMLVMLASKLCDLDLRGYLCWVENGESLTAFLDPEAQGPVQERLASARRLGEAAMAFVEAVEEIVR